MMRREGIEAEHLAVSRRMGATLTRYGKWGFFVLLACLAGALAGSLVSDWPGRVRDDTGHYAPATVSRLRKQIREWTPTDVRSPDPGGGSNGRNRALARAWKYCFHGLLWEPGVAETASTPLTIFDPDERCEFEVETNARFLRIEASNRAPELMLVDDVKRRSPRAFMNIVTGMMSHPNPSVRYSLVMTLSTTRDAETLRLLVEVLADEEDYVRDKALQCLEDALKGIEDLPDPKGTSLEQTRAQWRTWFESNAASLCWRDGAFRVVSPDAGEAGAHRDTRSRAHVPPNQLR